MLTFFQYKLYLTAVAGLGALWWPLGCKQLLSLEWGRKPEHSEETLNTERLQPLNSGSNPGPSCCEATLTTLSPCCLSKSHPNTVTVITHIFCQRFSWFPLRSFSSFPPLLPLYLYPQVFPAEQCRPELNIWVIWLDRSEEVRMTLSNKSSAQSINTEVPSLTTPSQHILKNSWLPKSPSCGSFDFD